MKNIFAVRIIILYLILLNISCESENSASQTDDDNQIFITTVKITLTPENGGDILISECYDQDGYEGLYYYDECSAWGVGEFNKTYIGTVQFLNENVEPPEDITNEIINNGNNYQVIFGAFTAGEAYTYEYLEPFDNNGDPIGINFKINSSSENCALVRILLDSGGTLKSAPHIGLAGEIISDNIIASGNLYVECNYD